MTLNEQSLEMLLQKEEQKRAEGAVDALTDGLKKAAEDTAKEMRRSFKLRGPKLKVAVRH